MSRDGNELISVEQETRVTILETLLRDKSEIKYNLDVECRVLEFTNSDKVFIQSKNENIIACSVSTSNLY